MATSNRNSRTQQTHEAEETHEQYGDVWDNPGTLDTSNIPARNGYVQRWVRTKVKGEDDQNNVYRKVNQGWKPRLRSSVPKGAFVPKIDFEGTDVIGIHGQILMERPEELHKRHGEHIRKMTRNQTTAVKQNIFNVHEKGSGLTAPTMNNKSEVSKGDPSFADD